MMTIAVVVPSWQYWFDPLKLQPLWEMYYATLLSERFPDSEIEIIDLRGRKSEPLHQAIPPRDVYVYWIMKSADAPEIYDIVKYLRELAPRSFHVAGGTHVDHHTDECISIFDASIVGSGEELLVGAIQDYRSRDWKSVYWSPVSFDFAAYPHANREFLPDDRIAHTRHFERYGRYVGTGAYFSRGCSFSCNFCVYNNPSKFQLRTPVQIDREIAYLKRRYGIQALNLRDEVCLPVNKRDALERLEVIGKRGIVWRGQTVPFASEEVVAEARRSGCVELALGVESVESDEVLKLANKPSQSVAANRRFIELLQKHGIKVKLDLIFGLPGETSQTLARTIQFLQDVQPDYVSLSGFDPVPGSFFHKNKDYYGITNISEDLKRHAHLIYRFGDDETVGLPFDYEKKAFWGEPLPRAQILDNIRRLQAYLREHEMSY